MVHQTSFISQGYSDSRYINFLVLSRIDYCNSLLTGLPQCLLDKLQRVQNCSARLISRSTKRISVTPLLSKLHCLPMVQRIEYTVSSTCYSVVLGTAPPYISDLLELFQPSRSLHSAADSRIFRVPMKKKKSRGFRALSHVGPCTWNKLRFSMCHSRSIPQFKVNLKTAL